MISNEYGDWDKNMNILHFTRPYNHIRCFVCQNSEGKI